MMDSEKSIPLPLSGDEIQEAALFKLREVMQHNTHLTQNNAYTSAKIEISVKMTLFDYGREVRNNLAVTADVDSGLPNESEPEVVEVSSMTEPMPPNQFRTETDQEVPVQTVVDGKKKVKFLKYQPRKSKT